MTTTTQSVLSGADIDALRHLRPHCKVALEKATTGLLVNGQTTELRRAYEGLAVVDRLLGDEGSSAIMEENALICIRCALARGWGVFFEEHPDVVFKRGEIVVHAVGFLAYDGGEGSLANAIDELLATASIATRKRFDA